MGLTQLGFFLSLLIICTNSELLRRNQIKQNLIQNPDNTLNHSDINFAKPDQYTCNEFLHDQYFQESILLQFEIKAKKLKPEEDPTIKRKNKTKISPKFAIQMSQVEKTGSQISLNDQFTLLPPEFGISFIEFEKLMPNERVFLLKNLQKVEQSIPEINHDNYILWEMVNAQENMQQKLSI